MSHLHPSIPIIPCTRMVCFPFLSQIDSPHVIPFLFLCELFLCLLLNDGRAILSNIMEETII